MVQLLKLRTKTMTAHQDDDDAARKVARERDRDIGRSHGVVVDDGLGHSRLARICHLAMHCPIERTARASQ
jgi:hypothetical protein